MIELMRKSLNEEINAKIIGTNFCKWTTNSEVGLRVFVSAVLK